MSRRVENRKRLVSVVESAVEDSGSGFGDAAFTGSERPASLPGREVFRW